MRGGSRHLHEVDVVCISRGVGLQPGCSDLICRIGSHRFEDKAHSHRPQDWGELTALAQSLLGSNPRRPVEMLYVICYRKIPRHDLISQLCVNTRIEQSTVDQPPVQKIEGI